MTHLGTRIKEIKMTEQDRQKALEARVARLEDHWESVIGKLAPIASPQPERVTVEQFADKMVRELRPDKDAVWNGIMEKYPNGLRIIPSPTTGEKK